MSTVKNRRYSKTNHQVAEVDGHGLCKKAAARVQSAAAREEVVRLEEVSQQHKRDIADKVAVFWREVSTCYNKCILLSGVRNKGKHINLL